jgi:hypothetical protein
MSSSASLSPNAIASFQKPPSARRKLDNAARQHRPRWDHLSSSRRDARTKQQAIQESEENRQANQQFQDVMLNGAASSFRA